MGVHGMRADIKAGRDLLITQPLFDSYDHFSFTMARAAEMGGRFSVTSENGTHILLETPIP